MEYNNEIDFGFPEPGKWNVTHPITLENLKMDARMIWLLCSLSSCILWVTYITFYNSRLIGLIITKIANKWYINGAFFKIGSIKISPLAGKVMFRDLVYINHDYSIRVQDGYFIFRWWRSYVPKDVSEDLSHSDTRLSVQLYGFELHLYNRSEVYDQLEKIFGLSSSVFGSNNNMTSEERTKIKEHILNMENDKQKNIRSKLKKKRSEAMTATTWRDLIPVIKVDICSGRIVFGNRLTPTTLSISVEEAHCMYSTKPAACRLDHFMHFVKAKVENFKVMFAPSLKYTGLVDEPPRYMGEGFVVMMSNFMELYFYMDEPGVVPDENVRITLANGDIVEPSNPMWGIDIKCGRGTDFSYGPWADRQRDKLFNFFFPADWQIMKPTPIPRPGELRKYQSFDISLCVLNEATIDILFSKEKETNAMHVTVGPGSYIEITIPWVTVSNGYSTKVTGQLLHAEATTSLQYRSLAEFESLQYKIEIHYPPKWNDCQNWTINLTGCKATAYIVYKHKCFFQELIEDWSIKSRPDILSFVPYVYKFTILLKEFEILTLSNEYNWIDCSSTNQENNHLAFCGDLFDLSFELPFSNFLPQNVALKFWIHGEGLDLSLKIPEIASSRLQLLSIDESAKILTRTGKIKKIRELHGKKWRRICQRESGWIDCWNVPIVALSIQYIYHPMPPLGPDPQADITTPEKEEILLSPMRMPKHGKTPVVNWGKKEKFDPTLLPPDHVTVEVEIGSSVLLAYGSVLRNLINLKENIFGEDQDFIDMEKSSPNKSKDSSIFSNSNKELLIPKDSKNIADDTIDFEEKNKAFDCRLYRPLHVVVTLTIHDIQAHLVKNCNDTDPPCPAILIERLGFEMNKRFTETELQVLVSPSYLISCDNLIRSSDEKHLKQGHMLLSAVQVRGHAMFSSEDCKLEEDTLEYAWLLEIQLGKISGKLTLPQLSNIVIGLDTFVFLVLDKENCLKSSKTEILCHHRIPNSQCPQTNEESKYKCPSSEDIKYRMTRVAVDAVDLYIVEHRSALHTWISPIRVATCNLHGQRVKNGVSGILPSILLRFFIATNETSLNKVNSNLFSNKNSNKICKEDGKVKRKFNTFSHRRNSYENKIEFSRKSQDYIFEKKNEETPNRFDRNLEEEYLTNWIEVGSVSLGPILLEMASALPIPDHKLHLVQHNFLKRHDLKFKRIWFLWTPNNSNVIDSVPRCGCTGGCAFFGSNRNGPKFFKPNAQDIIDNLNVAKYLVLKKSKDYGFGESILHEGQLVFHTPPYSLYEVLLYENSDCIGRLRNLKKNNDESEIIQNIDIKNNFDSLKKKTNNLIDAKSNKRYANMARQSSVEVPYSRLLESPSKKTMEQGNYDQRRSSDSKTNFLKISDHRSSVSDSRLTGDESNEQDDLQIPFEMSHSAPHHSHPLEFEMKSDNGKTSDCQVNIERTVSLTSENPSEMFFSANEEDTISRGNNSLYKANSTTSQRRMFLSEPSNSPTNLEESLNADNKRKNKTNKPKSDYPIERSSSETPSYSSNSYISAMSSQEDMGLIQSHNNKPIINSPILMGCYLNYLPQLKCSNWQSCSFPTGSDGFSTPLFQKNDSGGLTYIGNKMVPKFDIYHNWKEFKILPKYEQNSNSNTSNSFVNGPKSHPWDPSELIKDAENKSGQSTGVEDEFLSLHGDSANLCTSIVVRLKGQVNIFLTPLLLEGLQGMIETAIPVVSNVHMLTVVNLIHSYCIRKVTSDNILKRDENLGYWSQCWLKSKRSTTERSLQAAGDTVLSDVYEESISVKTQGIIILPKITVMLLQASVVDKISSLTALDNLQDLNCVSLLAFYIEGISSKFHMGKTTKASIHKVYVQQQNVRSGSSNKKGGIMRGTKAFLAHLSSQNRQDIDQGEPILIETSENQLEEIVITLDIGRAHAQLRRLNNSDKGSLDSQAIVTAIPEHRSKAMFECIKLPENELETNPGFIMLECGLEGVAVKIVKRSLFEKSENCKDEEIDLSENIKINKVNDYGGNTSASTSKTDFSWKLISKKPPTPKTPREKFAHALEHIIITGEAALKDTRNKHSSKSVPDESKDSQKTNDSKKRNFEPNFKETDKTSSCAIDLKCLWFNFAAPPCVPITRRIDLTRLDWNLLSTLSPAITSWINSSNRLAMKVVSFLRASHLRYTSVAACLMATSLENEKIQRKIKLNKSRYTSLHTLLSKTLQEDPSCQLCIIMQKLVLDDNSENIEEAFKQGDIPHINILRQGVIVLSRQWKNILYNPILFEHQYKNRLYSSIHFPFNQKEDECDEIDFETEPCPPPHETSDDNENALLLGKGDNDEYLFDDSIKNNYSNDINEIKIISGGAQQSFESSPNMNEIFRGKTKPTNILPPSTRSSIQMLPIISGLVEKQIQEIEYGTLPEGSLSSNSNSISKFWNTSAENEKDDLYFWMAKQEEKKQKKDSKSQMYRKNWNESQTKEFSQDSIRLLDAHLIFEPLLTCLGVMPQQMISKVVTTDISTLENFGTNLSIIGSFDSIRVDIVVSEAGEKKLKQKSNKKLSSKVFSDSPSFLCERVGIELEVCQLSDGFVDQCKQNVMYMSRRQMKKHISSVINFSLNVRFISQQVNMPLLRLLHQITNMYHNVREAQTEFQEQPELKKKILTTKDETSLTSDVNDIIEIGSVSDRLTHNDNSSDEKYDNFNYVPMNANFNTKIRHTNVGPLIHVTQSPHVKNRPQSFAQKLRSTGKSVKGKLGYTNLNETKASPMAESCTPVGQDDNVSKFVFDRVFTSSDPTKERLHDIEISSCWKIIYNLLDLYGNMPEPKMIQRSFKHSENNERNSKKSNDKPDIKIEDESTINNSKNIVPVQEKTRLMIFGVAKIHKTRLLATLSGLKLEAEITTLNSSVTWRKKTRPISLECSLTGQVGRAMIVLLEGVAPSQQTVVKIIFGKSQTLYSSITKKAKDKNSGLLSIGPVNIDIPQHPVALHGMMTRSSKQISSTLQELRVGRPSMRIRSDEFESPKRNSGGKEKQPNKPAAVSKSSQLNSNQHTSLLQPLVMQFNILLQSLSINAALLPSLQAQYKMNHVSSTGITGNKAKFVIDLPSHTLSFSTKIQSADAIMALPSEACIALPAVHVKAEYIAENNNEENELDGIVLRKGGYVNASAEIGEFERCLTTELLNHLVFVQKVFMREINEVIQKLYGSEKPVNIWLEGGIDNGNETTFKTILFSLNISIKRIQLTATTPCNSAVRFETEAMKLQISNRVGECHEQKVFGKAHIDFNLALGQIIKNVIFDEAEPEFQQYAFFHTVISLRNAFQDEFVNEDKELILLTLKRPLIYIQPIAIDKAILIWLNYKNAYEYWADKRAHLNYNLSSDDHEIIDKVHFGNIAASNLSMLYLQLAVEDMGICLPLNSNGTTWMSRTYQDFEPKGAVLITLENTIISACNSGSLVSKGKFFGLCLRFADDFETTLDDWKPNVNDTAMNLCIVSEGTYEVCSRTVAAKNSENAKWFLNVKWAMEGVDIHLDVNIGKQLSTLGHTLTMITGFEEEEENNDIIESPASDDAENCVKKRDLENLPSFVFDPTIDFKQRSIMMEKEMSEQLKIINDLRTLGASHNTIAHEEKRLQELQALCYKYFRRDIIQRLKRPSIRRPMLKPTNRSQSFVSSSFSTDRFEENDEMLDNRSQIDTNIPSNELFDVKNTPKSSHSRSASLRADKCGVSRIDRNVVLSDAIMRQSSVSSNTDFDDIYDDKDLMNNQILIDGTPVELRRKINMQTQKQQEPNIDFELDVKVFVNSGKCVLHTKGHNDDNRTGNVTIKQHKRERSFGNDFGSPTPSRRHRDKSKLRYNMIYSDLTVFHIPGLDIKLHYQSRTMCDENAAYKSNATETSISTNRRISNKKASLFVWMTLQSIPEETIISPHILEFLEQTLEPIPTKSLSNPVSLDLLPDNYVVYSSFNVDVIVYLNMQPSKFRFSCLPVSRVECMLQLPSLDIVFSSKRNDENENSDSDKKPCGGLSITGCLADFNVCVYHPYTHPNSKKISADSEKKASLSINVEFVKFHITRFKKVNYEQNLLKRPTADLNSRAVIRFSTLVDIGSASFKYDMRKLTEILAFPKAWYRRKIVRRLFLGDLSVKNQNDEFDFKNIKNISNLRDSVISGIEKEKQQTHSHNDKQFEKPLNLELDSNQTSWETLVLFGINFTKLNVQMNMGNVMGNVIWLTKDFQSDGSLVLSSTDYKNMYIGIHLGGSSLDAKGGIVGGNIEINQINTQFRIREERNKEPHHLNRLNFKALELRLDYMGTSVLMTRISDFAITLRDEWNIKHNSLMKLKKNYVIFIHGDVSWDQFQIMISKSTTVDLLKMFCKLEEFFTQQFKSSKRVFTNLEPRLNDRQSIKQKQRKANGEYDNSISDMSHHRHWQRPLELASRVLGLNTLSLAKSKLGGTVELQGNNISLACFHGVNFKSKSWALFSLREPRINFSTEAHHKNESKDVVVIQKLRVSLGQTKKTDQNLSMAIVSRITRNVIFPPQFKILNEWFQYAFAHSEIDAVDRFPILNRDKEIASNSIERSRASTGISKTQDHNHNREVIFALPSLQFNFKTEHFQGKMLPQINDARPVVLCSFITEFDDHIFVTVDADAFFFLHDLISSYIKEKEKMIGAQNGRAASPNLSGNASKHSHKSTILTENQNHNSSENNLADSSLKITSDSNGQIDFESLMKDWRHFECKTWHLEPTVRLLSWAGKSIEPYGIDYILNKLGFSHARTTIPKWLQRGFMDPFDKIQAVLMLQLLGLIKQNKQDEEQHVTP